VPIYSASLCIANHLVPIGFTLRPRRNLAAEIGPRYRYRNFSIVFPYAHTHARARALAIYIFVYIRACARALYLRVHAASIGGMRGSMRYLQDGGRTTSPTQNKQLTHTILSFSLSFSPAHPFPASFLTLRLAPRAHTSRSSHPPLASPRRLSLSW